MYDDGGATLTNVTFRANSAGEGGGLYETGFGATLTNVVFDKNSAVTDGGGLSWGGISADSSNPGEALTLTNVDFYGNSTPGQGGAISATALPANFVLTNDILW